MKTMERITPSSPAEEVTSVEATPRDKYARYADSILSESGRKLSKRRHKRFVNEIEHTLSNDDDREVKIAALSEVIDHTCAPVHKRIGAFVNTKVLGLYDRATTAPGNAARKYRERMDNLRSDKETDTRRTRTKKWLGRMATRSAVAGAAVTATAGVAATALFTKDYATTHSVAESFSNTANTIGNVYSFGGNGSGGNSYLHDLAKRTGLSNGRGDTLITSGRGDIEMGGVVPGQQTPANESNANMANRAAEAVAQNGDGSDVFIGHSQGTMAIAEYFQDNELAPDDKVVMIGGPYTPGQRLSENDLFKMIKPMAETAGVELDQEMPGGDNVLYVMNRNDLVGLSTNGKNNPGDILNRIVGTVAGDGHNYSAADIDGTTAHKDVVNEDGSITRIILNSDYVATNGTPIESGIGEGLAKNNIPVTAEQDDFYESIRGEEDGRWDMQEVADTGSVLAEQSMPGSGQVVHDALSAPEAQVVADTYMGTQEQFFSEAAQVVESNPVVQDAQTQVAEVWTDVAQSVPPEVVDQGIQMAQDFANNTPAAPYIPEIPAVPFIPEVPAAPAMPDLSAAINNFQIPKF